MDSGFDRRSFLVASGSLLVAGALPAAHAQGKTKLRFTCAFTEQDLRAEAYKAFAAAIKDRLRLRALLGQHAVQAGHRAGRAAARQPRDGQPRAAGHLQAAARVVADDLGLPVPRRRPPEEDVQERRRPRLHQDGARPARTSRSITPVYFGSRHVNLKPDKTDPHAGRSRRHQAAHAAGRVLAVPRRIDRRQPDAGRLRRGLHRAADRRHRRPGQSARC